MGEQRGDFEKVKNFLYKYQNLINGGYWVSLLQEANFVGLDNVDVRLMIELFYAAKLPITKDDIINYLIDEFIVMMGKFRSSPTLTNYYITDNGKIDIVKYFGRNGLHIAGLYWDQVKNFLLTEGEQLLPSLNNQWYIA